MARKTLHAFLGMSLLVLAPVSARTFEGFTLGAKAGVSLNNPYIYGSYHPGKALFALSPGLKFFENRLVVEGDLGISEKLYEHEREDWYHTSWRRTRDTLFLTSIWNDQEENVYRFFYSYKGVLNFGAWSLFAGQMVLVEFEDVREEGEREVQYTTSSIDTLITKSSEPYSSRYQWGDGIVVPIYGVTRRFGRWFVQVQGSSFFSLQAFVGASLWPVRAIGPHR